MSVLSEPSLSTHQATLQTARRGAVAPVTHTTASGVRVHGLHTAWISFKTAHHTLHGPEALRLPRILADPRWVQPRPVLSWVLEHPEGLIVIDSGEVAGVRDLERHLAPADPVNRHIVRGNFRVQCLPEMELGAQLERLGLSGQEVRWLVQTHLHFDHADNFAATPQAEVLIARAELEGHARRPLGALPALYPPGVRWKALEHRAGSYATFGAHEALTRAGDVRIVPTPGHSYGHQSVILRDLHHDFLFAGDLSFDLGQLERRELAGIVHDVAQARDSLERARRYVANGRVVYLPSHDPQSLERLAHVQVSRVRLP